MKKNIITIMAVVCMFISIGCVVGTKKAYDVKLADVSRQYEAQINRLKDKNEDLEKTMADMEEQVYNMKNNKAYKLKIRHGNEVHIYEQEKDGMFAFSTHAVIK